MEGFLALGFIICGVLSFDSCLDDVTGGNPMENSGGETLETLAGRCKAGLPGTQDTGETRGR